MEIRTSDPETILALREAIHRSRIIKRIRDNGVVTFWWIKSIEMITTDDPAESCIAIVHLFKTDKDGALV